MSRQNKNTIAADIIKEAYREIDEEKRAKIKAFVKRQLETIAQKEKQIESAKSDFDAKVEQLNAAIDKALQKVKDVEAGNFDKALAPAHCFSAIGSSLLSVPVQPGSYFRASE